MKRRILKISITFVLIIAIILLAAPSTLLSMNRFNCGGWPNNNCNCQDGEDGQDGQDGASGQNGVNGQDGKDGQNGKNGQNGRDVIRMFSIDGQNWRYESTPKDKYMLETNIYNGQVTHLIFEISFMVQQEDDSLVFIVK